MTLAYDPSGRLRQTVAGGATTQFLHGGNALLAEYNGAGTLLRRYVHGPGIDEPLVWYEGAGLTDKRYLIADRQGSIMAANGASTTRYTYGPYGEPDAWGGSRFRYTGQIALPEVSLYHYKARAYDPVLGRFLQTDPVGYADQMNLYAYVGNDPLNASDPSGKKWEFAPNSSWQFKMQFAKVAVKAALTGQAQGFIAVQNSPATVVVQEGSNHDFKYNVPTKTLTFDPTSGLEVAPGEVQSPAVGVLHEVGHAAEHLTNPRGFIDGWFTSDPTGDFPNLEERRVVEDVETPAAIKWGEPSRQTYTGTPVRVGCVTCREVVGDR